MADAPQFGEGVENLTPQHLNVDFVRRIIESGKFHPQQFVKEEVDESLEKTVDDIAANPEKESQILQEVQKANETTNPDEKRLKQLQLSQDNFPDTWRILYGALNAREVFDQEKVVHQKPSKVAKKM